MYPGEYYFFIQDLKKKKWPKFIKKIVIFLINTARVIILIPALIIIVIYDSILDLKYKYKNKSKKDSKRND